MTILRMRASSALLILTVILGIGSATATPVDLNAATAAYREGNAAYERGDFSAANEAYARAEANGGYDARLFYNHANSLFRSEKLGLSILYFEKARKLAPTDADILHNLEFARARVADKIPEPPANVLTRIVWGLHASYSPGGGVWVAWGLFAAGFAAFTASLFLPMMARVFLLAAGTTSFVVLLAFAPSLVYKVRQHGTPVRAVVLTPVTELHSGPGTNYELLFRAHEGTVFTIVSHEGEWIAVKLPDGRGGFVKASAVGEV
jgi:tetratricopeptide (TPR) repeat protein